MKVKDFFQDLQDVMDKHSIPGFTEPQSRVWVDIDEIEIDDHAHDWDREYRECFHEAVEWAIIRFKGLNK